jgi:catechol 2,3-dioxygenase-like lactoylglutathione lyase family enzyme
MPTAPTGDARIEGAVLDHVAHAVPRWQDVWHRYATDLGAEWNSGGPGPGFAPAQLRFANAARVEVLMPWDTAVNDFLSRFLAASGPGPHHLTFKVPDLEEAIERTRTFGIDPIGISFADPEWMECFLHPKLASGVVVQLAQQRVAWRSEPPDDYPVERRRRADGSGPVPPAALLHVCHVVADLEGARDLFGGLLGGAVTADGVADRLRWVDLAWPGPLGVRLVGPADADPDGPVPRVLGGLPGRVHHLRMEVEEPAGVPGAAPAASLFGTLGDDAASGAFEIDRADNAGLGLVLVPASSRRDGATEPVPVDR